MLCIGDAGIRGNMVNCHPYPRDQKRPVQKHPEPFPDPEWYQELEEAKSRPIGPTDIIPQVSDHFCNFCLD